MRDVAGSQAEIIRWPQDAGRRGELAAAGRPRLLVLDAGQPAPDLDELEDAIWMPTDERDLFARLDRLAARARRVASRSSAPQVSPGGVMTVGARHVDLPPIEAALMALLCAEPRRVRTRQDLAVAAWGEDSRQRRSLDSRIFTLRARIAPLGLVVHSIHGRGFLLDVEESP